MQIEIGKTYVTGYGHVHMVMEAITETSHRDWDPDLYKNGFRFIDNVGNYLMPNGQIYYNGATTKADIIREHEMSAEDREWIIRNYTPSGE